MRSKSRKYLQRLGWFLLGAMAAPFAIVLIKVDAKPELEIWHRYRPASELEAGRNEPSDLEAYLELEEELFAETRSEMTAHPNPEAAVSRFAPGSPTCPWDFEVDDNRTFVLEPETIRGGAVLLHGLSDSPHSMRALGDLLVDAGYLVVGLRLPGHGTVPAGLLEAEVEDWQAAVRIAVLHVADALPDGLPIVMAGYSNGSVLSLDYTLTSLGDDELPTPDRLIMLSPAFSVSSTARWASWVHLLSRFPGLGKLGFTSVHPEFDPYKYNSFTVNAGAQIYRLTDDVQSALAAIRSSGRQHEIPPILAFQSLVDATISTVDTLERLLGAMEDNGSHVVLFDVNDNSRIDSVLQPFVGALRERIERRQVHPFDATVLRNVHPDSSEVEIVSRKAGSLVDERSALGMSWPAGVYSLSHVALPFPADDPVYGVVGGEGEVLPLGRLELRGERRVLRIPPDLLQRLRYNPFFGFVESTVLDFLGESPRAGSGDAEISDRAVALDLPTRFPAPDRLVAIGDLHGDLEATRAALRLAGAMDEQDRWIGGQLVVVQTGDQLDRGGDELEILDLLDSLGDQARSAGGDVHVLNGNHELMNAKLDMRYVTPEGFLDFLETPVDDPAKATPQQVVEGVTARTYAMRPGGEIALRFAERNVVVIVGDTVFVHGGVLPHLVDYGLERLNQETRDWLRKKSSCAPDVLFPSEGPIWSRHYSDEPDEADCRMLGEVLEELGASRMVVAHTVQDGGVSSACDQKVWRIDVGIATHYGGALEVLEIQGGAVGIVAAAGD